MHRQHVLVAMREHALRRIVAGALRCTAGFEVVEAFDDVDAIDEIVEADRPFDAILRDGRRDPEGVLDALSRIRHADAFAPVLLVVGHAATPWFADEALMLGARLLALPITSTGLRAVLAAFPSRTIVPAVESTPFPEFTPLSDATPLPLAEEDEFLRVFPEGPEHVSRVAAAPRP